jgi:hypothetical protein
MRRYFAALHFVWNWPKTDIEMTPKDVCYQG